MIKENDGIKLKFLEIVFCTYYSCYCKRPVVLRKAIVFFFFEKKTTFLTQKCKITIIMCFDNVCTIIV